jgi:hypothetical protein
VRQQKTGSGTPIPQRQSIVTTSEQERIRQQPASSQYTGQYADINLEEDYDLEEDNQYYDIRPHTSSRRYDLLPEHVIQQGNRTFHVHHGSPPVPPRQQQQRRYFEEQEEPKPSRYHPLVILGIAIFVMIVGWVAFTALGTWIQQKQDDWTYGQSPRTYQTSAVVGHSDSSTSPSHFIALNLNGQIIIIELPGGNAAKARSYTITTVQGNEGNPPVKVSFQDLNADGKLDMIVTIGDPGSSFTVMLFNDGTQFVSKLSK